MKSLSMIGMVVVASLLLLRLGESEEYYEEPRSASNGGWLTSLSPLPLGIYDHTAVYVESLGKIYIFGGTTDGTDVLDLTYEYDIAGDLWTPKAPMPGGPRKKMASAIVKGKIYVMGGEDGDTLTFFDRCEEYNPAGDTWNLMAPLPTPKKLHTAVSWRDTLIYVVGGIKEPYPGIVLRDVEIYNPGVDSWISWDQVNGLIQARKNHASGIIGDEIFVSAGRLGVGPCMRSTERGRIDPLNPSSISWTSMANLPFESQGGGGAAWNGFFYIHVGDSCGLIRPETYRLNPLCNLWERLPDKPTPVTSANQAFVAAESLIFFIGGYSGDSATVVTEALSDTILYDLGLSLDSLPDTVYIDSTYNIVANVWNCGNVDQVYEVVCLLNGYVDTVSIASCLSPGETTQVFLDPWLVPPPDNTLYIVDCCINPPDSGTCWDCDEDTVLAVYSTGITEKEEVRDQRFGFLKIEPNPFSFTTTIRYTLPVGAIHELPLHVSLKVYDLTGRLVRTLMEGQLPITPPQAGQLPITIGWDGRGEGESLLPAGIYFLKLNGEGMSRVEKLVILR